MDATSGPQGNIGLPYQERHQEKDNRQPFVTRVILATQTSHVGADELVFVGDYSGQAVYRKMTTEELARKRQMHALGVKIGKVGAALLIVVIVMKVISVINSYTQ